MRHGFLLAALVTYIASYCGRQAHLYLAAICVAMSRSWLLVPAFAALGIAFSQVFQERSRRRTGALIGAVAAQVMLRWPPIWFHGSTALIAGATTVYLAASAYHRQPKRVRRRARREAAIAVGVLAVLALPLVVAAVLGEASVSQGQQAAVSACRTRAAGCHNRRRANSR